MLKPGDVVLIKMHPASGQELKKFRPAIVLQDYAPRNFVTFIPLTSQVQTNSSLEYPIVSSSTNGLDKSSLALCWYIQTVGIKRIQKSLGKLTKQDLNKVSSLTKKFLAL